MTSITGSVTATPSFKLQTNVQSGQAASSIKAENIDDSKGSLNVKASSGGPGGGSSSSSSSTEVKSEDRVNNPDGSLTITTTYKDDTKKVKTTAPDPTKADPIYTETHPKPNAAMTIKPEFMNAPRGSFISITV